MSRPQTWLNEFKTFILRGNLVELAVAFVIGVAFAAVITAFVNDWITPLIGAIFGGRAPSTTSASRSGAATSTTATSSTR